MLKMSFPWEVVVSIGSVRLLSPVPCAFSRSTTSSRCRSDWPNRSYFQMDRPPVDLAGQNTRTFPDRGVWELDRFVGSR